MYQIKFIQGGDNSGNKKLTLGTPTVIGSHQKQTQEAEAFLQKTFNDMFKKDPTKKLAQTTTSKATTTKKSSTEAPQSPSKGKAASSSSSSSSSSKGNSDVAYVKPDGTKVYKGVGANDEKNPFDNPESREILGNIYDKTKKHEAQGKSTEEALKHATEEALDEADKKRERIINDTMKRTKCSRHEAEVKYLQKYRGLSREEAESSIAKRDKAKNSAEKANNPNYDPMTSLGYGYRQVLRYLQVARQCGFVLVKLDSKVADLAKKYNLEVTDDYVKIPRDILEKAAKEVEERDNIDRRKFEKEMACDKCGHNHHGAIKQGKETK